MTGFVPLYAQQLPDANTMGSISEYLNLSRVPVVLFILLSTFLVIRYFTKLLGYLGSRSTRARFVVRWAEPLARILLWLGALLYCGELLAPNQEAFITALASVALAVGLGAQDLIKNLLGGLVILADRPFQLGDRVKVGDAYGEIDYIGLHSVRLTTPDDSRVTIPNAQVVSTQLFNANSGVPDCQVVTDLFLPPATDPQLATRIGYEAAHTSPYLLARKPVVVLVSDMLQERPYLRLRIKAYVYDHRFEPRMQSDITARAKAEFLRRGLLDDWMGSKPDSPRAMAS